MSELRRTIDEFASSMKDAVRAYVAFAREVVRTAGDIAKWVEPALKAQILYKKIVMNATPNELRMMHNKRKRIRNKYYNRVKRRITK